MTLHAVEPTITKREALRLLAARVGECELSVDMGRTISKAQITKDTITVAGLTLLKEKLKKVKDETCYVIRDGELLPVAMFSEQSNFYYKLHPTQGWPTLKISSTPMHRHTRMLPEQSAKQMVDQIKPITGVVLDTCCGLGYTAILAAKHAEKVLTFEIDPFVQEMAKYNPYSQELFTAKNIVIRIEDIGEAITSMPGNSVDRILHDPPTFRYAEHLYSPAFHKELFRVLKKGGILYHYTPRPGKLKGIPFYPRIIRQLTKAGFTDVEYSEQASGIRAIKPK